MIGNITEEELTSYPAMIYGVENETVDAMVEIRVNLNFPNKMVSQKCVMSLAEIIGWRSRSWV